MDFIHLDYNLFKHKINKKHSFVLYLGGTWCKNCRAINHVISNMSKENNINIYNLDSRIGDKEPIDDFRKCNNEEQTNQYREFIELLNYKNEETVVIEDEEFNLIDTKLPKLSVPALIVINDGILIDTLIEEHEEGISSEVEIELKNKLNNLFKKLDNH